MLGERIADPHCHAAVDLCSGQRGVDQSPAVVNIDDIEYVDASLGNIDFDLGKAAAERIGVIRALTGAFRRNVLCLGGMVE